MVNNKRNFGRKLINLAVVLAIGLLALFFQTNALAEDKKHEILLSPASDTIDLKAGQTFEGKFKVYNTGDIDFDFNVSASPYSVKNEDYDQDFNQQTDQTQLSDWVEFEQVDYFIKAGESVDVKYKVDVPKDIPAGGQYAVLFAETALNSEGSSIKANQRVGILLYAHTDGKTVLEGNADQPKIPKIKFDSNLVVKQLIENTGNTDFDATVQMTVKTLFGKEIEINLNSPDGKQLHNREGIKVLPKSRRAIEVKWQSAPLFGLYKVNISTKFLDKTSESDGWVLFISPIIIAIIALAIIMIIIWSRYGKPKQNYKK